MQATLNTATPIRPKIGRLPASLSLPPLPEKIDASPWHPRLIIFSLAIVLAMTLVLSRVIAPSPHEISPQALPPAPPPAQLAVNPPAIVGALIPIDPVESAIAYSEKAGKPPIDNAARQRLLSILSKD